MNHLRQRYAYILSAIVLSAITPGSRAAVPQGSAGKFQLTSSAFDSGSTIPERFTCRGSNISPALKWTAPPSGTKSLALIVEDPDAPAGTWIHWVIYDLPANGRELPEGTPKDGVLKGGVAQGRNSFPKLGYDGPCPPPGPAHRYFFRLYALDARMALKSGATKVELEKAMKGHILATAELMGRYGR